MHVEKRFCAHCHLQGHLVANCQANSSKTIVCESKASVGHFINIGRGRQNVSSDVEDVFHEDIFAKQGLLEKVAIVNDPTCAKTSIEAGLPTTTTTTTTSSDDKTKTNNNNDDGNDEQHSHTSTRFRNRSLPTTTTSEPTMTKLMFDGDLDADDDERRRRSIRRRRDDDEQGSPVRGQAARMSPLGAWATTTVTVTTGR